MNNCRDWAFSNSGLEVWLPAFQLPMFAECRKEIWLKCLSKESIPAIPFWNSKQPLTARSGFLQLQKRRASWYNTALHYACIMPIPSLQLQEKDQSHAGKQSGHGVVISKTCHVQYYRVVASKIWITGHWLCSQLWHVTAANQLTVEIELLAIVGGKCGCQRFSADVRKMWRTAERRFVWHVCLRNPFPLFLLGIPSIRSLPKAGFWEPQYVPPGLHYACIMPIPSLQLKEKELSHTEKKWVLSRSCPLQDLLQYSDFALSCAMWLLQTNEQLSRLSF